MADSFADPGAFDRARFESRLKTRRLGHTLVTRAETGSTNDDAWEALQAGAPDGVAVIADRQTRGRGRSGRTWHTAPARGLALSIALRPGCDSESITTVPLVVGLALARALDALGVHTRLKWPNDLLLRDRKVAGILCESRRLPATSDVVVIGVGVNVSETVSDFPPPLAGQAMSLHLAGHDVTREDVAAAFFNALEPMWTEHEEGGPQAVLEGWRARADLWGTTVAVRAPSGIVRGVARDLDRDGALVIETAAGTQRILAGDVELDALASADDA